MLARLVHAWSSDNVNSVGGLLFREDAGGDMDVEVVQATANTNDGDGVRFQGTGVARLQRVGASGNAGREIRTDAVVLTRIPPGS